MSKYNKDTRTGVEILNKLKTSSTSNDNKLFFDHLINDSNLAQVIDNYNVLGTIYNLGSLTNININLSSEEKKQFITIYNSRQKTLKKAIKERQISNFNKEYCWYCRIRKEDTLDHFLPKQDTKVAYPELAVFQNNLLLCCFKCNTKKKGDIKDNQNNMLYINPYFFDIDSISFLKCEISCNSGIPIYKFDIDETSISSQELKIAINHQYKEKPLELIKRYNDSVSEEITNIVNVYGAYEDKSEEKFKHWLTNRISQISNDFGNNYWLVPLYKAIHDSPTTIKYLLNIR